MKCSHKKVSTPFCPVCGVRVRPEGVKSEILEYLTERMNTCSNKVEMYKQGIIDGGRNHGQVAEEYRQFCREKEPEEQARLDRWNRWIAWTLKQEAGE